LDVGESSILQMVLEVKERENTAAKYYADAALNTASLMGKKLFEQLAQFETYHHQKLAALEENLSQRDAFIKYERHEIPTTPRLILAAENIKDQDNFKAIINQALDEERNSEMVYLGLADEVADPDGHYMFSRLSEEEHLHFHLLKEAYWNLLHSSSRNWPLH
jgi:rubrerythrin